MKKTLEEPIYFKQQSQLFSDNLYTIKLFTENSSTFSTAHLNYMPHVPR